MGAAELALYEDTFRYNDEEFSYREVVHLSRQAIPREIHVGPFPAIPIARGLTIGIYVVGRPAPLIVKDSVHLSGITGKLEHAYRILAYLTFASRLAPYFDQLKDVGYFDYAGMRFFPGSDTLVCGTQTYDLAACTCSYEPFALCVRQRGESGKKALASTLIDQDVLFVLLEKLYGIRL